jgi:hypothetical protein
MIPQYTIPVGFLLILCFFVAWWWRQRVVRKRIVEAVKAMAESGRNEISGQPVEYWLNILNQDTTQPIIPTDTMVLIYKGQEYFFIDGGIAYWAQGKCTCSYALQKAFFLVAVGQSAVRLLSQQEQAFRLITGSTELAAFSVFRWSAFAYIVMTEKDRRGRH